MKKKVRINGHEHEFTFELRDDKAVGGHFNGAEGPELIKDLVAEYGPDATIHGIVTKLITDLKLYHVTINELVCKDFTYEVWGINDDDAKTEAMIGNGEPISEHEISTEFEVVDCQVVEDDDD